MKELLRQYFELERKKIWLKAIDKEIDRYKHLYHKTNNQHHILSTMVNRYNEIYGDNLELGGKK